MAVRRPTINDVARSAGVSQGRRLVRAERPARASPPRPGPGSSRSPRELGWTPSHRGPGAVGLQGARRRPGHRPPARDPAAPTRSSPPSSPASRPCSPRRAGPRAAGRARPASESRGLPPAGRRRPGRRRLPHRPAGRRPAPRAARRARAARGHRSARPASTATGPCVGRRRPARASPPRSSTSSTSGTPAHRPRRRPGRDSCTAGPAAGAWAARSRDAGLPEGPCVEADFSAPGGAAATRALLDRRDPPTAIVYANDLMAIAGMALAAARGLDVPARPVRHRLRRHRDRRPPPAAADHRAHRRLGWGGPPRTAARRSSTDATPPT